MAEISTSANEGPRAYQITHNDHRGVLMCIALIFMGYAVMIIGMRLSARVRTMGIDDYLAIVGTVLSLIQSGTVIAGVSHYLGASFGTHSEEDEAYVAKMLMAGDVILLVALGVVKAAVIWLCRRLFSVNQKSSRIFCDVALGLSAAWCIGSIIAITAGCDAEAALGTGNGTCPGLVKRWSAIGTLDAILELYIFFLAIIIVWPLQMSFSRRVSALMCFIVRIPIIIPIALHVTYLSRSINDPNRGVALVKPLVIRQTELLFSLFSAAVPALNQYLRKYTLMGAGTYGNSSQGYSYGLKSLTKDTHTHDGPSRNRADFVPPQNKYTAAVGGRGYSHRSSSPANASSLSRQNSDDLIIRKDIHYEITYSDAESDAVKRR